MLTVLGKRPKLLVYTFQFVGLPLSDREKQIIKKDI